MGAWWNRISGRRMRHGLFVPRAANGNLAARESLAYLEEPCLGGQVSLRWLAQEIDVEINRHREGNRSDCCEHGHIHGEIRERHHGRTRNCAAGSQRYRAEGLSYPAA